MSEERTKIWTDGGSSSNNPPFGIGYGSYRINEDGKIVSLFYKTQMSSNAAEILTMANALAACSDEKINIYSDSRTGLKWVNEVQKTNFIVSDSISEGMKRAIKYLSSVVSGKNINTHWRPREQIFKIFGH